MKTKATAILLYLISIAFSVSAQKNKLKFHSINSAGITIGQSGEHGLFQTVNGLKYGDWFSGIGVGADYYFYNSYPLFIDARRYFGQKGKGFCYADLGYNFSGKNKPAKEIYYNTYNFFGGIYTDIGIGYKMKFLKNSSFLISAGFSYKEIKNKVGLIYPCYAAGSCPLDYSNYSYGFGTAVLKAGVDF